MVRLDEELAYRKLKEARFLLLEALGLFGDNPGIEGLMRDALSKSLDALDLPLQYLSRLCD